MAEFSKISKFVDDASLAKDTAFFLSQLTAIETAALSTAQKVKAALSSFGTQTAGSGNGTKKTIDGMKELTLTTANYTKVLAAVGLEVDNLTDAQKQNLRAINENFKVEEQARQGAKETVKLIQTEIQQTEKLAAGRTNLAQTLANNNAQIKSEKLERDRLAKVLAAENGSREKAQATIDLLINKGKKLNLETDQGRRVNEAYNKTIERLNAFLIANNDVESNRIKNIGNYNAAANIIVQAMDKEQKKLEALIATRNKYNNAGASNPIGFARGNTGNDTQASAGTGPTSSAGGTAYAEIGKDAQFAATEIDKLDKEIEQSRVIIEGFNRVSKELPIAKASDNAEKEVKTLNDSLAVLVRNGFGASEAANQLRTKINELTSGLVRAEAATSAIDQIDKELQQLTARLATVGKGSKEFELITKQIQMLKGVSTGLDRTFGKSTQELRALEEAAKKIATTFGVASSQFQNFAKIAGARKDQLKDVQNALKFQASDTKGLDATLQGVQAITSAYGAYQAVVALTGEKNEDLEKSMQKLQAVTALVVSIQSIANALQSDSAFVQGLLAVKAYALAAAQQALTVVTAETTVALAAEATTAVATSVSVSQLTVAQHAAGVASLQMSVANGTATLSTVALGTAATGAAVGLEAGAVGAASLEASLGGVVVAEAAVATGATAMATAIAATGIGLIVIALSVAVYKLVTALQSQAKASASTQKANEALAGSLKALTEATKIYEDLNRQSTNRQLADLDRLIAKRKALGVNSTQSLALDINAANARAKAAEEEVKQNGITIESIKDREIAALVSAGSVRAAESLKLQFIQNTQKAQDKNFDKNLELQDKNIARAKERYDADAAAYERDLGLFTTATDTKQNVELLYNQAVKLSADERRKFIQESTKIEAEIIISKNDETLSNERSTLQQRLKALESNLVERRKIIQADNKAVQDDPTASNVDKNLSAKSSKAELAKIERESGIEIALLKEEFRLRDLAAQKETLKLLLDEVVQNNQAIVDNDSLTEEERLESLKTSLLARKAILEADLDEQLANAGITDKDIDRIKKTGFFEIENKKITNEELKKLIVEYNSAEETLAEEGAIKLIEVQKDYYQKYSELREDAIEDTELEEKLHIDKLTIAYNEQLIKLNNSLQAGEISRNTFNNRKLQSEKEFQRESLQIQVEAIEKKLAATVSATEVEAKLLKELNDLKSFTGPEEDDEKVVRAARIKAVTDELETVKDVIGQESELYKKLSELKSLLSEGDTLEFTENQEKIIEGFEKIQSIANEVFSGISGVMDGLGKREKERLQEQIEGIDKKKERELAANAASQLSEEKKAENVIRINARAQAQKEELERRQKKIDRDRAVSEKAMSIFQIILATTINVAKALTPFGKVLAAVSGAAQLAIALSTPIPKFKRGLYNDYIGYAWVGDGGKREAIKRATGKVEVTPATDTLTYINKGDRIEPDAEEYFKRVQGHAMGTVIKQTQAGPITQDNYGKIMVAELSKQTEMIVGAIKEKSEMNMSVTEAGIISYWQHGFNRTTYLNEQTNWK